MRDIKYQTGLKRLWAVIIDSIVFLPFLLAERWIYKITDDTIIPFIWTTLLAFAPLLYSVFLLYKYGQTIGKWVVGVEVVDLSETRKLDFKQSILRDIFYLIIQTVGLFYFLFLIFQSGKGELINDYKSFSDQPILWWTLIELITMLTNQKTGST